MAYESTTVIPGKPPVEILTQDGNQVENAGTSLDNILSLAEAGKPIQDAIQEVQDSKDAKKPDVEEKIEVVKDEEITQEPTDLDKKLSDAQSKKDDDGRVSREKLLKETEEKPDVKPELKDEKKPDVDAEAVPEDELKVLPHDKPKTAKRIQALLKKIDSVNATFSETKKDAEAKAARLQELEKQLGEVKTVDPVVAEQVKAQQDELAMFRRRYELDKDPAVATRFSSRHESAEKSITEVLTRRLAGEALLGVIKEEGGWNKFSESSRILTVNAKEGGTEQVPASELADRILVSLPLGERKRVEAAMLEQISASTEKARFFEEETKKASEFFKKRDEDELKQQEEQRKSFSETQKLVEDFQKTAFEKNDWLKEKDIPPTATPEQKAAIEQDNKYTKQLQGLLKQALSTKDVPGMLGIVMDSVAYYNERRNSARLASENKQLKADLAAQKESMDKFRQASRTTTKPGSISGGSAASAQSKPKAATSLEEALVAIERGGRPDGSDEE